MPDFGFGGYKRPEPTPAPHHAPGPAPAAHALKHSDDDIWGGYRAKYAGPTPAPHAAKPVQASWQPRPYAAFDVSQYLAKGRAALDRIDAHGSHGHHDDEPYWWEEPSGAGHGHDAPWRDEPTAYPPVGGGGRGAAPAQHYKPAYTPYVPRSARPTPGAPRVKYEAKPLKKYWWQK